MALVLLIYSVLIFSGCIIETSNGDIATNPTVITSPLLWNEAQGRFYTNDITKAQAKIPFNIILPTYIPYDGQTFPLPIIDGLLETDNLDNSIKVNITYNTFSSNIPPGIILITEANYKVSLGDVQLNPELEVIDIGNIEVIKTRDDFSEIDAYFSFNDNGVYYVIETHYLTHEESLKIVVSIIDQLK